MNQSTKQRVILHFCVYTYDEGWPGLYIYPVYDRIFGDFPAKKIRIFTVYVWFWPTYIRFVTVIRPNQPKKGCHTHIHCHTHTMQLRTPVN